MDKALVIQKNVESKAVCTAVEDMGTASLQLVPKFKEKQSGFVRKQNILEEDAYVEVRFFEVFESNFSAFVCE